MSTWIKRLLSLGLLVSVQFGGQAVAQLRNAADNRGLFVGAAVNITPFRNEAQYTTVLGREYNMLVAENVMKFDALEPSQNSFNFTDADALVNFAQTHGMVVRGHNLIWHNQIPSWLANGNFTRDQLIAIMQNHITKVIQHFGPTVVAWDVVNEAISDNNGQLRTDSFWYRGIGPDYIQMAFQFARAASSSVKLYYNDYNIEGSGAKPDAAFNLVSQLKSQTLIDGIGWQMHQVNPFTISAANQSNAARLQNLGLELSLTELDIRIQLPDDSTKQQQQANGYASVMNFCLAQPRCVAVVTWGFTDKYSWIPGTFSGFGDALPFDTNYQPKPAYTAMLNALGGGSPPPPPTGLSASPGNGQVQLSWNASTGATSYNVKRATVSGGPYTLAGTTTTTSFLNTGLTNGTTYFFVVSAVNSNGESANSSQVSATPRGTPDFTLAANPSSLTVNRGSSGMSTITITRINSFASAVTFSTGTLPAGVTASFNPVTTTTTGTSSVLTLSASATATLGTSTVTVTGTGGGLTRNTTITLTVGPGGGGTGGVTITPVVSANSPWFNEEDVRLSNTGALTAMTVTIVVQRTTGVSFSGQYNTVGGQITQANSSTTSTVTYTFTLNAGQSLNAGNYTFAAQTSGTGTAHPTAGDTWTVTYTTGGQNFTQTGHF